MSVTQFDSTLDGSQRYTPRLTTLYTTLILGQTARSNKRLNLSTSKKSVLNFVFFLLDEKIEVCTLLTNEVDRVFFIGNRETLLDDLSDRKQKCQRLF